MAVPASSPAGPGRTGPRRTRRRETAGAPGPRVYSRGRARRAVAAALGLAAWLLGALAVPVAAQSAGGGRAFTLDPAMSRGPARAPVTIVEFSDYQ